MQPHYLACMERNRSFLIATTTELGVLQVLLALITVPFRYQQRYQLAKD